MPRWDEKKYQCFVDSGSVPKSANEIVFNSIWLKKMNQQNNVPFIWIEITFPSILIFFHLIFVLSLSKKNHKPVGSHQVHADRWAAKDYLCGHL